MAERMPPQSAAGTIVGATGASVSAAGASPPIPGTPTPTQVPLPTSTRDGVNAVGIRVRMYRVGFGDFFLLTVPGKTGPAHILIDCGVHAANIKSMDGCVKDLIQETQGKLALVILTHYHADHMSGFASNYDDFARCVVGAVWITNRLDPGDPAASKFHAQLASVANQLQVQLRLSARTDVAAQQALAQVQNARGDDDDGGGGGSNAKALQLLQSGFANKPPVHYYEAGMEPALPAELQGILTAKILGPAPRQIANRFSSADNSAEQYLAAAGAGDASFDNGQLQFKPFDREWPAQASDYPPEAFKFFDDGSREMEGRLHDLQPDALLAAASNLDGTLNNQSLVVLFTCMGKKLLFVGDAQWGNWAYWLYGRPVTGKNPGILDQAKQILGSIDFYKVGHHGSTNANPIPAVAAINATCACMCSTATGAYGDPAKMTEVPRVALLSGLAQRTGNRLVRSDWVAVDGAPADPAARAALAELPDGFATSPGKPYVDYHL
jgi:beta-lactamase superfamily II metal-dependent hydrolase